MLGIRHWTSPEYTRVVIDLSQPTEFRDRLIDGPDRVPIDIEDAVFAPEIEAFEIDDGLVKRIRVNRLRGPKAQIVLDLARAAEYRAFSLRAFQSKPDRIVVDVFRESTAPEDVDLVQSPDDGTDVIVIDPGHGGEDPGALGFGKLMEKDIAFEFSRDLKRELESRRDNIRVELTRTGDYYVKLRDRYRFAESKSADVFVSVHANAHKNKSARGAEVFFLTLGEATDTEARRIAELENASDLVGGAPPEEQSDLVSILADLQMKGTLSRSSALGDALFASLREANLIKTRNVRQARFLALQSARVPSVLLELGFITNKADAKLMKDSKFRARYCRAVADGVLAYLDLIRN